MDESIEFEALVATYERRIYNLLLRMVNDPEDAADLTQEIGRASCRERV